MSGEENLRNLQVTVSFSNLDRESPESLNRPKYQRGNPLQQHTETGKRGKQQKKETQTYQSLGRPPDTLKTLLLLLKTTQAAIAGHPLNTINKRGTPQSKLAPSQPPEELKQRNTVAPPPLFTCNHSGNPRTEKGDTPIAQTQKRKLPKHYSPSVYLFTPPLQLEELKQVYIMASLPLINSNHSGNPLTEKGDTPIAQIQGRKPSKHSSQIKSPSDHTKNECRGLL